jgi:hypothetical protein
MKRSRVEQWHPAFTVGFVIARGGEGMLEAAALRKPLWGGNRLLKKRRLSG